METPRDRASSLGPLRNGTFRAIWLASLASNLGGLVQAVGAAWMMTSITESASMVALVQASTTLPIMLFSLFSGAIADSFNRRGVMLAAQVFMFCVSAALAAAAYFGLLTPWLLLGFTFLIGSGTALNNPAWQASIGDMVPRSDVPAAVTLNSAGFNISRSVGPAVGGAIVAAAGAAAAFAVNALSYLALIFVLLRWKPPVLISTLPRETLGAAVRAGLRYVAMSPNITTVLMRSCIFGVSSSAVMALLPLVVRHQLGGGPLTYGILFGAFGAGAVTVAFLSGRLRAAASGETIIRIAFVGFALCAGLLAVSAEPWQAGIAMVIGGACWVLAFSLFNVTVQLSTPRWVVGRALALYQTAAFGGLAVGSWVWGIVAESSGAATALLAAAAALLGGALIGLRLPLPGFAELNLDPLARWKEPHIALDVTPRSGPISVMIEYRIDETDLIDFLDAMADRKRVRLRDGAQHWTLMRDLGDPALWVESYQTPTWVEYVRHNQRATQADGFIGDRLRELHRGPEGPRVHRMIVRQTTWGHSEPTPKSATDVP